MKTKVKDNLQIYCLIKDRIRNIFALNQVCCNIDNDDYNTLVWDGGWFNPRLTRLRDTVEVAVYDGPFFEASDPTENMLNEKL